jgi:hypothetical protein
VATEPATVKSTLLGALRNAHFLLEATMADVTDDIANRPAAGTANPIGSAYAHAVFAEDRAVEAPPLAALPAPKKRLSKSRPHRGGKRSNVYRIALWSLGWRKLHASMTSSRRPNSDDSDSWRRPSDGGLRPGSKGQPPLFTTAW